VVLRMFNSLHRWTCVLHFVLVISTGTVYFAVVCCSSLQGNRQIKASVVRSKSCSLKCSSAAALLLGSRVRVPVRAWILVSRVYRVLCT